MNSRTIDMYAHNTGRINGYGVRTAFKGDADKPAVCAFCGASTKLHINRYAWHNCHGFICPATDKTPAEAKRIKLTAAGAVVGETDELVNL